MNIPFHNEVFHTAGWIGSTELIVIVIIVVILFGGRKIPELMRGIGKGVKEFKEGIADDGEKGEGKESPQKESPQK